MKPRETLFLSKEGNGRETSKSGLTVGLDPHSFEGVTDIPPIKLPKSSIYKMGLTFGSGRLGHIWRRLMKNPEKSLNFLE